MKISKKVLELKIAEDKRKEAQEWLVSLQKTTIAFPTQRMTLPELEALKAQVALMFDNDKDTRIRATTKLIIERKQDSDVVPLAVAKAKENPDNKSGVINTLVLLESINPKILRKYQTEIESLFAMISGNGEQTKDHIKKVKSLLTDEAN